jgi:hypothetical protein
MHIITNKWMHWNKLVGCILRNAESAVISDLDLCKLGIEEAFSPYDIQFARISASLLDTLPPDVLLQVGHRLLTESKDFREAYSRRFDRFGYAYVSCAAATRDMVTSFLKSGKRLPRLLWIASKDAIHVVGVQDSLGHVVQL